MDIWKKILALESETISMRESIHLHPELSDHEDATCELITSYLEQHGVEAVNVPGGGVLGFIRGIDTGKTVMLRADVDALPVQEDPKNLKCDKKTVSCINGVSHACGHDAHTAMLLSAARVLQDMRSELHGNVVLMFERGEEKTMNCTRLFHYLEQHHIDVDSVFALHMHPELESGKVAINDGPVMASNVCFDVKIKGKGGHGSRPDLAASPIDCFVAVYQAISGIRMNQISPFQPMTCSIGYLAAGHTNNVIPDELIFKGSSRFYDREQGILFKKKLTQILDAVTAAYDCTYEYLLLRGPCYPVINDPECAKMERSKLARLIGEESVCRCEPELGSETFARTMAKWSGVYVLLGTGNEVLGTGAPIHSAKFDIDTDVLKYGVAAHVAYATGFLNSDIKTTKFGGSFADIYRTLDLPQDQIKYLQGETDDYFSN